MKYYCVDKMIIIRLTSSLLTFTVDIIIILLWTVLSTEDKSFILHSVYDCDRVLSMYSSRTDNKGVCSMICTLHNLHSLSFRT